MENKKTSDSCDINKEQGFHGNQYVDSQGKHKSGSSSSTTNTGSSTNTGSAGQTGGKSPGSSRGGGNHGNQYVDSEGHPRSKK